MKEKIGVGITTCNRPDFFKDCINSLDFSKLDHVVVVNDGKIFDFEIPEKLIFIQNEHNLGISKSKNKIFKKLLELNCEHIFTMEDDCIIKDNNIFQKYITASKKTGLKHFNFGPGSPWNRKQQPGLIGDLSKRHLASQQTEPNPRLMVNYGDDITISLYEHIVAMFCYFRKEVLDEVGLMDEEFYNAWEHVEHTYRIIQKGKYTPFWWFADISDSQDYIQEAKDEKARTSLAKNEETFNKQVQAGLQVFYRKHGIVPSAINGSHSTEFIKKTLKGIYNSK
jgi:GT2 family glycosyltransferase